MSESLGAVLFGGCLCLVALLIFLSRKRLAKVAVNVVPTQNRERHYRLQIRTLATGSGIVFLAGLAFAAWGLTGL